MKHIIPFYLLLCVTGGIAALILLYIVYRKNPRRDLLFFNLFFSAMTLDIFINLILMYRSLNITEVFTLQDYLLTLISMPLSFVMFTAFPMAVHRILEVSGEKLRNRILIVLNAIVYLIPYFPAGTSYDTEAGALTMGPLFFVIGSSQLLIIIYSAALLLFGFRRIGNKTIRRFLMLGGILTLIFIPGFFHDITYSMGKSIMDIFPIEIIIFPFYYFILAALVIVYTGKYFITITQLENNVHLSAEKLNEISGKFGLTEREREVFPLIVEGLGNKQIAGRLCISTKTVSNHIYNMYRKLSINSRYELLAMF